MFTTMAGTELELFVFDLENESLISWGTLLISMSSRVGLWKETKKRSLSAAMIRSSWEAVKSAFGSGLSSGRYRNRARFFPCHCATRKYPRGSQ